MIPWVWILATGWAASMLDCSPSMFLYEQWNRRTQNDNNKNNNKTLWIVGASSGIGKEVALQLPTYNLILSARSKDKLQQVAAQCRRNNNNNNNQSNIIRIYPFDITSQRQIRHTVRSLPSSVDIVWINAGIGGYSLSPVEEIKSFPNVLQTIFETNTLGPIHLIQQLRKERPNIQHFVVTSSVAGHLPVPLSSIYTASKHALHGFLKSLGVEQPQLRIDVLCPGTIDTPFHPTVVLLDPDKTMKTFKMSSIRCGQLITATIQRQRPSKGYNEIWIAQQPTLMTMYLNQWFPTLTQSFISRYVGPRRIDIWKRGLDVYDPLSWGKTNNNNNLRKQTENIVLK